MPEDVLDSRRLRRPFVVGEDLNAVVQRNLDQAEWLRRPFVVGEDLNSSLSQSITLHSGGCADRSWSARISTDELLDVAAPPAGCADRSWSARISTRYAWL